MFQSAYKYPQFVNEMAHSCKNVNYLVNYDPSLWCGHRVAEEGIREAGVYSVMLSHVLAGPRICRGGDLLVALAELIQFASISIDTKRNTSET
jgi:hypothetical protein